MVPARHVALGVTGSIAAYKAAELARRLVRDGFGVTAILTRSAQQLVGAATFQALTGRPAVTDLWTTGSPAEIEHIALADRCAAVLVAPATANILGKMAAGIADDFLSTFLLAVRCPVLAAPAMNVHMLAHPAVQANLETLRRRGVRLIEPASGELACGTIGAGRLAEIDDILDALRNALQPADLAGRRIVVSAGPTREPLDPVRFFSNRSSGRMGFALARAARARGAAVCLVAGPTELAPPTGVDLKRVVTAEEMRQALLAARAGADAVIMAAAVADFRPHTLQPHKIKKAGGPPAVVLVPTPDILAEMGRERRERVLVGFAAETRALAAAARRKLAAKNLDLLVANDVGRPGAGFESEANAVTIFAPGVPPESIELASKDEIAHRILDRVAKLLQD